MDVCATTKEDAVVDVIADAIPDKDAVFKDDIVVKDVVEDTELEALKSQSHSLFEQQKQQEGNASDGRGSKVVVLSSNGIEYDLEPPQNKNLFPKALTTVYHNLKWGEGCLYTGATFETDNRILGVLGFTVGASNSIVVHALSYMLDSKSHREIEMCPADIPACEVTKIANMNTSYKALFYSKLKTYSFVASRTSTRKALKTYFLLDRSVLPRQ